MFESGVWCAGLLSLTGTVVLHRGCNVSGLPLAQMSMVETTVTGAPDDLERISQLVGDLVAAHRLPSKVVFDLHVVLDEALSNIIKYGCGDGRTRKIQVRLTVSEQVVKVEIEDDGPAFDPLSIPPPKLDVPLAQRKVGGLGIHFMRNLMSGVTYSRLADRNLLVLEKSLREDPDGPV
jgi:serine/threonine-protein kinase RsbW